MVTLLTPDPGEDSRTVADLGNLFLARWALDHLDEAERCLDDFLDSNPTSGEIEELLMDSSVLADVLPAVTDRATAFRRRLEEEAAGRGP